MYTALTYIIKQKGTSFMTSKELTKLAVAALEDRKAEDVTPPMKPYTKPA